VNEDITAKMLEAIAETFEAMAKRLREIAEANRGLKKARGIEEIRKAFPQDLANMLTFENSEGFVVIRPRQYLGSETFSKIGAIVKGLQGEYISQGKSSHFRIKK